MTAEAIRLVPVGAQPPDGASKPSPAELLTPFDEQTRFDVADGRRQAFALRTAPDGSLAGSAVLGGGAIDLFIHQASRARSLGGSAAAQLLDLAGPGPLTAWSHEDHPAARALAARFGFTAVRTLMKLRLDLPPVDSPRGRHEAELPAFGTFRPGRDDTEWLALNARVFATHPEQGAMTQDDLDERRAESWFDPEDFVISRDSSGRMVGFCWLKVEPPAGEVYVIGVAAEASGQGLGRALLTAGLTRLRARGCTVATLYVEGDNAAAVHLYRAVGFVDDEVHVQYARG